MTGWRRSQRAGEKLVPAPTLLNKSAAIDGLSFWLMLTPRIQIALVVAARANQFLEHELCPSIESNSVSPESATIFWQSSPYPSPGF